MSPIKIFNDTCFRAITLIYQITNTCYNVYSIGEDSKHSLRFYTDKFNIIHYHVIIEFNENALKVIENIDIDNLDKYNLFNDFRLIITIHKRLEKIRKIC